MSEFLLINQMHLENYLVSEFQFLEEEESDF